MRARKREHEEAVNGHMKELKQIFASALMLGVLSVSALAVDQPQKRDEQKQPPPKPEKVVEKTEKQREQPPPRRDDNERENRGDRRGKP